MPYKNSRELLNSTDVLEVWITAGGPFTPISYEDSIVFQPIDPFASSRDSKSFFSEWIETPTSSKRSSKAQRESFLSFSGSSFDWSFLPLPRHRRNRRRERPVSVQTVPSPSSPRHASPSHRRFSSTPDSFSPSYKRSSYFVDPSKGESWMPDKQPFEEDCSWQKPRPAEQQRADPIQSVDWRQFHLEVLQQEA
ncbi:hypothetical protein H0H92_000460 [Tricholoma furcatifolium]|nr:hypothetical protein H0H92_000460 [Tricholoma furcatifolium]